MKKDFLLEILVQELPYKFIPSAIAQLKSSFEKLFNDEALTFEDIKVYATPRRLAVLVSNLNDSQDNIIKDIKGPILNIAKNPDGSLSHAGLGFMKKNGVDEDSLYEKDNYIFAKVEIKGKSSKEILKDNVEDIILKLQGAHFMRWGYNTQKFSRPIENVVALLGNEVIELNVLDKKSSNKTFGHRFSSNKELTILEPKNYIEELKKGNVIVNQDERKDLIIKLATKCAEENNLKIQFDDDLLEEVTFITEWPVAVLCEFDERYLQIPNIVTTTVMIQHQRYFPLWTKDNKLSNRFITIANYVGSDFTNIKQGNQRVITARLDDGVFFYQEDTKTKLIDKLDALKGMTFQKGLGTLFDKTNRIIELSSTISDELNISNKDNILRIATLAKCDLSTKLVFEFTELQGFIGESYAKFDKENEIVQKGISEHYFPLNANSELPSSIESQIVSIADKIDTICALFISTQFDKKKKRPTGSNDPLGARRSAIGILRIILENNLKLNLKNIIEKSLNLLSKEFSIELEETILDEIKDFFVQRLLFMYEKEFSVNLINSLNCFNPLEDLSGFILKAEIIKKYLLNDEFKKLSEMATRTTRIIKDYKPGGQIKNDLFVLDEEKALFEAIKNHNEDKNDLEKYIKSLYVLIEPVDKFFDKVLVMDKNENIKNNRLELLSSLKEKFSAVCDFEKL